MFADVSFWQKNLTILYFKVSDEMIQNVTQTLREMDGTFFHYIVLMTTDMLMNKSNQIGGRLLSLNT